MTKNGLASVRERIRQAFVTQVHGDVRDEEQVRASREMLAAITKPPAQVEQSNLLKTKTEYSEQNEQAFHTRAQYFSHAALRSTQIRSHRVLPRGVHQCYVVETPTESASELFEQALRQLGAK
jgi:hypothetical protein